MNAASAEAPTGDIPIHTMKKYISYCKSKCAPRLSPEAAEKLSNHFVTIRAEVRGQEQETNERSSIPITIRQLEAIVRISESLAKITLSPIATEQHVDEAIRLFKVSTLDAVHAGQMSNAPFLVVIFLFFSFRFFSFSDFF
jgi:DNA replication licensing factor MCM5